MLYEKPQAHLIVVDDEESMLEVIKDTLGAFYSLTTFSSPERCLEFCKEFNAPFILLSDYQIGEKSGVDLCFNVIQSCPAVSGITLMSGSADLYRASEPLLSFSFRNGTPAFLIEKPFQLRTLHSLLQNTEKMKDVMRFLIEMECSADFSRLSPALPPGAVLKVARETVGLSEREVCDLHARVHGYEIGVADYQAYESLEQPIYTDLLLRLQDTLELPLETIENGYSRNQHVMRVVRQTMLKSTTLPIRAKLLGHLLELSRSYDSKRLFQLG